MRALDSDGLRRAVAVPAVLSRALITAGVLAAAALVGMLSAQTRFVGLFLAAAPLALVLAVRALRALIVVAMAAIPFSADLLGGAGPGVQVAAADMLLAVCAAALLVPLVRDAQVRARLRTLRPLLFPLFVYGAALVVVLAGSLSFGSVANSLQRVELALIPAVVAAVVMDARTLRAGLRWYVVSSAALAVAFTIAQAAGSGDVLFGVQKNPAGQFIASGLLLAVGTNIFSARTRAVLLPLLTIGLVTTQSRGALLAFALSLLVLLVFRGEVRRLRVGLLIAGISLFAIGAVGALPQTQQDRLFRTSGDSDYAVRIRDAYRDDALQIIRDNPFVGVGIGQYLAGDPRLDTQTTDPHNVLLLEFAEGGFVLGASFLVFAVVPVVVVLRRRQSHPLAAVAAAVHVGILSHGLVDTYWVRGTPVLGWLLLGYVVSSGTWGEGSGDEGRDGPRDRLRGAERPGRGARSAVR